MSLIWGSTQQMSLVLRLNNNFKNRRPIKLKIFLPKETKLFITKNYYESEAILFSGKGVAYNIVKAKINDRKLLELHLVAKEDK